MRCKLLKPVVPIIPTNDNKADKYYVVLIDGCGYQTADVWINLDKLFGHVPNKGECFRYKMDNSNKPAHCTVMAIVADKEKAKEIAKNLYI